ncbi:TRAP transporter small permease subunit [Vibrio nitrifigilis]|uniref:TRAP transporter small permease protein n=1 Tax=Vibrio nitrifigilis TaxID=2789781 RepID=A0ABS0GLK1_9VIBR|nr:TRAP transporter small permease [Vibrio nitrifigilis]MBF9003094.1 TRAP transporter small permease [Vibrio nitrifigilis]
MSPYSHQPLWLTKVNQALSELCGWLLIFMMLFMCIDLITRGLSKPLYGVSELAMFTMISITYLGLSHSEETHSHINVDFLLEKLPTYWQCLLNIFISSISVVTIGFITWALWNNALAAFESKQAIAGPQPILLYPVKFIMTFALALYFVQAAINGYSHLLNFHHQRNSQGV